MRKVIHCSLALVLGLTAAVLVSSCGGSGKGLIPLANAGPLQSDFETVANAAREGNGNCAATTTALEKTQRDFQALPSSVNAALRKRLSEGITNLHDRALALCEQPLVTTTSAPATTNTQTTPATTNTQTPPTTTTSTQTTPTTTTNTQTTTTPGQGGGTQGPGEGSQGAGEKEEPQGGGPGPPPGASGGTGQGAGQ